MIHFKQCNKNLNYEQIYWEPGFSNFASFWGSLESLEASAARDSERTFLMLYLYFDGGNVTNDSQLASRAPVNTREKTQGPTYYTDVIACMYTCKGWL